MLGFFDKVRKLVRRGNSAQDELRANAQKALRMKREAGPQTHIPEHQTPHQGGVKGAQVNYSDTGIGKESTWTSNLKRSHNARVGDGK